MIEFVIEHKTCFPVLSTSDVAIANKVPLAVVFNLLPGFEGATIRHFGFMVKGLQTTAEILEEHGIPFLITQVRLLFSRR